VACAVIYNPLGISTIDTSINSSIHTSPGVY
jgi:hypothetical protein